MIVTLNLCISFQTQGLGTALKILFSGRFDTTEAPIMTDNKNAENREMKLKRSEIVSLFNAFGR